VKLYEKIRQERKKRKLSLQDVYNLVYTRYGPKGCIGYQTLFRIEKGKIAKFVNILKICSVFGITLTELFKNTEYENRMLIRKNERINCYSYNDKVSADVISGPSTNFIQYEVTFEPQGKTIIEQSPHDGKAYEKSIYVTTGELTCTIDNEEFILKAKDNLCFNSTFPHFFENKKNNRCICLIYQNPKHY